MATEERPTPSSSDTPPSTSFQFRCSRPNFTIRTVPDLTIFRVNKQKMASESAVFRDMFGVCDDLLPSDDGTIPSDQSMEIHERSEIFGLFLALLHGDVTPEKIGGDQPTAPVVAASSDSDPEAWGSDTNSQHSTAAPAIQIPPPPPNPIISEILNLTTPPPFTPLPPLPPLIPLPLLRPLFDLADKYDISAPLEDILHQHLKRNGPQNALEVYSLAHQLDLTSIASYASSFLLSRPLDTYTHEEVAMYFPSLKAYHRLTLLHAHRKRLLQEVVMKEDLFPHRYGWCSQHGDHAVKTWELHRNALKQRITPGTNVKVEMTLVKGSLDQKCGLCAAATERAIDMLKYKVSKVPYAFDRVPDAL